MEQQVDTAAILSDPAPGRNNNENVGRRLEWGSWKRRMEGKGNECDVRGPSTTRNMKTSEEAHLQRRELEVNL